MIKRLIEMLSKSKKKNRSSFRYKKLVQRNGFSAEDIEKYENGNFSTRRVMTYEDDRFDGGIEKELVGYELHKLSKMY